MRVRRAALSVIKNSRRQARLSGGSSAGAGLVAGYVADPQLHPAPGNIGIAGVLLLAGTFDFTFFPVTPNIKQYLGEDDSRYRERSPCAVS